MNDNESLQRDLQDEFEQRQARLTAYALDQLDDGERRAVENELAGSESDRQFVAQMRRLVGAVGQAADSNDVAISSSLRAAIENRLAELEVETSKSTGNNERRKPSKPETAQPARRRLWLALTIAGCLLLGALPLGMAVMALRTHVNAASRGSSNHVSQLALAAGNYHDTYREFSGNNYMKNFDFYVIDGSNSMHEGALEGQGRGDRPEDAFGRGRYDSQVRAQLQKGAAVAGKSPHPNNNQHPVDLYNVSDGMDSNNLDRDFDGIVDQVELDRGLYYQASRDQRAPMTATYGGTTLSKEQIAAGQGGYGMAAANNQAADYDVWYAGGYPGASGYSMDERTARDGADYGSMPGMGAGEWRFRGKSQPQLSKNPYASRPFVIDGEAMMDGGYAGGEQYDPIYENRFLAVSQQPLSTFSVDVDTASYTNVRRFLNDGALPPPSAVRIEELVNYFRYGDPAPTGDAPFAVRLETSECPWRPEHRLLRVSLKGKEIHQKERPASNLVFLLDVSGSMADENKLPLLKSSMNMLARELGENDRVAIVTYAGEAGLRLDSTRGDKGRKIRDAIDALSAGGSTNGSAGIELAYEKAAENFIQDGINRVILATDGDLNVGVTDDDALVELIKQRAKSGVFLTVLGFGTGNLKDSKLEKLADNGNGAYAYIDGMREARRVLVEQISGSLATIAKDVKIQIEFNPAEVAGYRLIGYENRLLAAPDFDNDKKDAGEIGAGHSVTALYEIIPAGAAGKASADRPSLKYQQPAQRAAARQQLTSAAESGELLTLFLRYKQPDADESRLLEFTHRDDGSKFGKASDDFRFAAAVASFGMLLRGSEFSGHATFAAVEEIASASLGEDPQGYRTEFVDLVRKAAAIK